MLLALAAGSDAARVAAQPVSSASAIKLDGELSEEVWQKASVVSGFRQREPNEGAAATFETEARVAYDANALYVAVQAIDPEPARIVGIRTRRDESSPSDWIRVMIDSFHDRRSAYEFAVNPAGVKSDTYWYNDTNNDRGLGRRVGRRRQPQRPRLARGIPRTVLSAALSSRRRLDLRAGHRARDRPPQRKRRPGRCWQRARPVSCRRSAS